jgi:hypothetical protein
MPETTTIEGTYALKLAGWERYSIWGLDPMETTYGLFAQLWRNTDDRDGDPRHWISGIQDLLTLARKIAGVTGTDPDDVANAIAESLGWATEPAPPEQPWVPGPEEMPFTTILLNPLGDRHLAFDDDNGRFCRLWQHRSPEPLTADEAIRLRPSDIDVIIKVALVWIVGHHDDPRSYTLVDELAAGAKAVVKHFGKAAQALRTESSRDPAPRWDVQGHPASDPGRALAASFERHAGALAEIDALRSPSRKP